MRNEEIDKGSNIEMKAEKGKEKQRENKGARESSSAARTQEERGAAGAQAGLVSVWELVFIYASVFVLFVTAFLKYN